VFGRRGGAHMASNAKEAELAELSDKPAARTLDLLNGILTRTEGENGADIRDELQGSMFDYAFVVRDHEGLTKMTEILADLEQRYRSVAIMDKGSVYNTDLMETVELGFLLDCAHALVASALARDESRGGHFREDHPLRDDVHWLKHTLATRAPDGAITLDYKDVKMGPYVPMERKY
jgi:succinate dehydrogenase / fumarate reductase flavoprotein subunit